MRFKPKTEDEVQQAGLLPAAEYPFEILEAEDKLSKAGNDMIALKIGIDTDEGRRVVFDYLVEAVEYKLRHLFDTIGQLEMYESGNIDAAGLVGCTGTAKIAIQPAKDGYDAKNVVKDYVKRAAKQSSPGKPKAAPKGKQMAVDDLDDGSEIPF